MEVFVGAPRASFEMSSDGKSGVEASSKKTDFDGGFCYLSRFSVSISQMSSCPQSLKPFSSISFTIKTRIGTIKLAFIYIASHLTGVSRILAFIIPKSIWHGYSRKTVILARANSRRPTVEKRQKILICPRSADWKTDCFCLFVRK